jgi:hypothetical protein
MMLALICFGLVASPNPIPHNKFKLSYPHIPSKSARGLAFASRPYPVPSTLFHPREFNFCDQISEF